MSVAGGRGPSLRFLKRGYLHSDFTAHLNIHSQSHSSLTELAV